MYYLLLFLKTNHLVRLMLKIIYNLFRLLRYLNIELIKQIIVKCWIYHRIEKKIKMGLKFINMVLKELNKLYQIKLKILM